MKGLYNKYIVTKASGKPIDPEAEFIVLRIDSGQYLRACRAGVHAFADAVREENSILADDIERRLQELAVEGIILKTKHAPQAVFLTLNTSMTGVKPSILWEKLKRRNQND